MKNNKKILLSFIVGILATSMIFISQAGATNSEIKFEEIVLMNVDTINQDFYKITHLCSYELNLVENCQITKEKFKPNFIRKYTQKVKGGYTINYDYEEFFYRVENSNNYRKGSFDTQLFQKESPRKSKLTKILNKKIGGN